MGNSTPSASYNKTMYTYEHVHDIPQGTPPPSLNELNQKVKEISLYAIQKFDPADMKRCREWVSHDKNRDLTQSETQKIRDDLSTYEPNNSKTFSEKTYQFQMNGAPDLWITSTKNSDNTLSYWFQYPILPFHVQSAFLSSMGLPINSENLNQIQHRYSAVYKQLLRMNQNEISKCEQIEPLYVDMAIKALLARGYRSKKRISNFE
jgi:hypothetical protein